MKDVDVGRGRELSRYRTDRTRLRWLEKGVQAPQDHHGKNEVAILVADVDVAEAIIRNRLNERDQFVRSDVVH